MFRNAISNFNRSLLAKRLLIGILLFSSAVTLLTTLAVLINDYRQDMSVTEENLEQIKASNLNSLALSIWNYDDEQIYLQLDGILNFPAISYVSLLSTHNVLYERGTQKESNWIEALKLDVKFEDERVAQLSMHIDYGALYNRLFNKAMIIMVSQFIKTFLVSLFILLLAQSLITRHLVKMSEYAGQLNLNNLDRVLELDRRPMKDELSDVVKSVNFMRESLKQDIAKREEAERALDHSQKRLRLALDTANLGIMEVNLNNFHCQADERFAEQLGFHRDQFQSLQDPWLWWVEQMEAEDRKNVEACIENLTKGQLHQADIQVAMRSTHADHSQIYFRLLMTLTGKHDDPEATLLCSQWDVTEQVLNHQRIQMLNQNLEQKVKDRTQALQSSNHELKSALNKLEDVIEQLKSTQQQLILNEKMATLGHLLFGVAHELNTPLGICTTAISASEKLIKDIKERVSEKEMVALNELEEYTQLIQSNILRAIQIIKAFKELSVDQSEPLEVIDLLKFTHDIVSILTPEIPQHLKIQITGVDSLEISTYPNTLKKVIEALVLNAKLHAFEAQQEGLIRIHITVENNNAVINVMDNGKGIGEQEKKKIFDAFFTTKRNQGGLGLGLNITYNLVHGVLGGNISCDNVATGGASFTVSIPIHHKPMISDNAKQA